MSLPSASFSMPSKLSQNITLLKFIKPNSFAFRADYQEWPFQGFLKRVRIGNETTYNLEFKLPCISERFDLPISDKYLVLFPGKTHSQRL